MSLAEEVDVLRQIALFERMEPAKLKLLCHDQRPGSPFRPGGTMMRQGDDGDAAYVVITGASANVLVNTPSGPLKVAELGAGQIVGEIAILVDIPRTATVEAQDELVALKISKDNFLRLLNSSPQVGIEVIRVLASRLENTTNPTPRSHREITEVSRLDSAIRRLEAQRACLNRAAAMVKGCARHRAGAWSRQWPNLRPPQSITAP